MADQCGGCFTLWSSGIVYQNTNEMQLHDTLQIWSSSYSHDFITNCISQIFPSPLPELLSFKGSLVRLMHIHHCYGSSYVYLWPQLCSLKSLASYLQGFCWYITERRLPSILHYFVEILYWLMVSAIQGHFVLLYWLQVILFHSAVLDVNWWLYICAHNPN